MRSVIDNGGGTSCRADDGKDLCLGLTMLTPFLVFSLGSAFPAKFQVFKSEIKENDLAHRDGKNFASQF